MKTQVLAPRSTARRRWPRWVSALLVAAWLPACTVTLISHYDEQIDTAATALQKRMDSHLTTLESATGAAATYDANKEFYADYQVELRAVELRAGVHPKNEISLRQYALMTSNLEDLRQTHETDTTLTEGYIAVVRDLFNQAWGAIIALEVAKKRGD